MLCPCCGFEINGKKNECPNCKALTKKPKTCSDCGAVITDQMKCPNADKHNK